jgi:hypothetical protein
MPLTYQLIARTILSSTNSTVTFSSIPNTYTDLVLRSSTRSQSGTIWASNPYYQFNGGNASVTAINGTGASGVGARSTLAFTIFNGAGAGANSAGNTANTFSSHELYLPNYLTSATKPANNFSVSEQNGTTAYMNADAYFRNSTSAITSLSIIDGNTFDVGSSFYLYGIKNS